MFTISDLAEMTGLTDRTLRNYLSAGFLQGEKADGKWQFTPEQFEAFLCYNEGKASARAYLTRRDDNVYNF